MQRFTLEYEDELNEILNKYCGGEEWKTTEPLDGDEVDILTEIIRRQLNYMNGNITREEYFESEK